MCMTTIDHPHLSDRQVRILQLMADGATNRAIAHRLGYSVSHIEHMVSKLYLILGVADRGAAVAAGFRGKWLT